MLVDSHCHLNLLDLTEFSGNLQGIIDEAKLNNVQHMLCVAVEKENFSDLFKISQVYSEVNISIGIHPNEAKDQDASFEELIIFGSKPKVVAIGETGLDYYRAHASEFCNKAENSLAKSIDWQRERFRRHIQAAKVLKKPIIVHTRQAQADTIKILKEEGAQDVGGVMHCFTETLDMAKQAMDLNFYISFAGIVTFKNATELKELVKKIPLDRMLIETDSPFLAPVPFRGKPNRPAYVKYVAEHIAELRKESFDKIANQTTQNFFDLFRPFVKET